MHISALVIGSRGEILFGRSNIGRRQRRGMWHTRLRLAVHSVSRLAGPKENEYLENLGVDEKIILKCL